MRGEFTVPAVVHLEGDMAGKAQQLPAHRFGWFAIFAGAERQPVRDGRDQSDHTGHRTTYQQSMTRACRIRHHRAMQTHEVIKTRRSVLGMSQPDLAAAAGISTRQLARYEDPAEPTQPPLDVADRLAAALEISLLTLAGHGVPALDLSGTWYSAWQTWMDNVERVEMERLTMRQDGEFVRILGESDPDHTDTGSYSWVGEARLIRNRSVCGWYAATDEGISSCGTIQLVFNTHGTLALGRWAGLSHDGISESGWGAMASTEPLAREALAAIVQTQGTLHSFPDLPTSEFHG